MCTPAGLTSVAASATSVAISRRRTRARGTAPGCTTRQATTLTPTTRHSAMPLTKPACRFAHTSSSGGSAQTARVDPSRQRISTYRVSADPNTVTTCPRTPSTDAPTRHDSNSAAARNDPGTRTDRGTVRTATTNAAGATTPITTMASHVPTCSTTDTSTSYAHCWP